MKAKVTIGKRKPDEVDICHLTFRPGSNKIVLYVEGRPFEYAPEDLHSIIIGDNGKATITPIDLDIIGDIYAVLGWLNQFDLPTFEFGIN